MKKTIIMTIVDIIDRDWFAAPADRAIIVVPADRRGSLQLSCKSNYI